jgi:tripartite-type tricarboxylate transporter receptor subunit TctC
MNPASIKRRQFIAAGALGMLAPQTFAQSSPRYPNRPVRIVIGFAPGGTTDVFARLLASKAATVLGQAVVVDNKPGAGAIIAADHVAKSPADGYTLFLTFSEAIVANTALYRNLPHQPARDFSFISLVATGPLVVAVHKDVPANNLRELVAYAKAGRAMNWGSWGAGSHGHLLCEAMNKRYELNMLHVPYKGEGPTIQDLVAGQIQIAAGSIGGMSPHIKSGALKAIGVIGNDRSRAVPNVSTLVEQGATDAAFQIIGWIGLVAPAGLPAEIRLRWEAILRDALAAEDVASRFRAFGFEPKPLSGDAFFKLWQNDLPIWTKLIRDSGVTLD